MSSSVGLYSVTVIVLMLSEYLVSCDAMIRTVRTDGELQQRSITNADALRLFMLCYLVDSASSRMLGPRTKPCKSKYESLYDETADGCLQQLWFL